jgi:hypothetical protein
MTVNDEQMQMLQDNLPGFKFSQLQTYWTHLSDEHEYASTDFPCYQSLRITSPVEGAVEKAVKSIWSGESGSLSLELLASSPAEYKDKQAGTDVDADRWFYQNWGTRYEPWEVDVVEVDGGVQFRFLTALLPADEWVKRVAAAHPDVNVVFDWAETSGYTSGFLTFNRGGYSAMENIDDIPPARWLMLGHDTDSYFTQALGCPYGLFEYLDEDEDTATVPSSFLYALLEFDLEELLYEDGYQEGIDDEEQSPQALMDLILAHPNYDKKKAKKVKVGSRVPLYPVGYQPQ